MHFAKQVAGFNNLHPLQKMNLIEKWRKEYKPTIEVGITSRGNIGLIDVFPENIRKNMEKDIKKLI